MASPDQKQARSASPLKMFLRPLLALLVLGALFLLVDISELWGALKELTWGAVFLLLLLSVVMIHVSVIKWRLFLQALGSEQSSLRLFGLYLVGYFVNLLMPSYLGGDAVRSWYVGKRAGQHQALAATILERYTGVVAMLGMALVFMWFAAGVTEQIRWFVVAATVGVVFGTALCLSAQLSRWFARLPVVGRFAKHIERVQAGFRLARREPRLLLKALGLSLVFHSLTVVNTVVAGAAVGWYSAPWGELFVVLPLILLIAAIPVTPSGLGIQEGAFFYFLQVVGASPAQALGAALVLRAKVYVLAAVGGIVWLFMRASDDKG